MWWAPSNQLKAFREKTEAPQGRQNYVCSLPSDSSCNINSSLHLQPAGLPVDFRLVHLWRWANHPPQNRGEYIYLHRHIHTYTYIYIHTHILLILFFWKTPLIQPITEAMNCGHSEQRGFQVSSFITNVMTHYVPQMAITAHLRQVDRSQNSL